MATLESRKYHIYILFGFFFLVYLSRLFYVQIIAKDFFETRAEHDAVDVDIEFPPRGNIYDRNGQVLVQNEIAYDIMITMRDFKVDTQKFCSLLEIDTVVFTQNIKENKSEKNKGNTTYIPKVFISLMKYEKICGIKKRLFNYKGVSVKKRTIRNYPKPIGAHVLGYTNKVSSSDLRKDKYYTPRDYKGASGLESYYEKELRGQKGVRRYLTNIKGERIASYLEGALDTVSIAGENLSTTLDVNLQEYGEYLMQGKLGAIVAIEPSSGEVLALVNAPTYNPNLLSGGCLLYTSPSSRDS